jgi:diguanylate cyclase (GGDEF)-like protein
LLELDPRTLATYTAAISGLLALLALGYGRMRRVYPGFGWWTVSLVLVSAALASIALRGLGWPLMFDYGGTVFGAAAMLAILRGQQGFCSAPLPLAPAIAFAAAGLALMVGADLAIDDLSLRAMAGATTTGGLALYAAWGFGHERMRGLRGAALFCAVVLGVFGAFRLWRAGYLYAAGPSFDILAVSIPSTINYMVNATFATLWAFGFVLLNTGRLEVDLDASRAELERLAATDPLTGLRNRRAFFVEAEAELRRARRYKLPVSMLLLDIDRFKQVNDRFGHLAGDELLRQVSATIVRELRTTDIHARFGGEEFVALLVQTPTADAQPTAERLRRAIAALSVQSLGELFGTTASIGVTSVGDGDVELDELLRYADAALYRAKQAGRDRVVTA